MDKSGGAHLSRNKSSFRKDHSQRSKKPGVPCSMLSFENNEFVKDRHPDLSWEVCISEKMMKKAKEIYERERKKKSEKESLRTVTVTLRM